MNFEFDVEPLFKIILPLVRDSDLNPSTMPAVLGILFTVLCKTHVKITPQNVKIHFPREF